MERFLWVCFAGALGTGARYLLGVWAGERLGASFPVATLVVNVVGCLAIAFVMQMSLALTSFPPTLRLALTTGFLGGLTTYSSFNYETTKLIEDGARTIALLNVAATLFGCFVAGLLGLVLARRIFG
jgi:fluoride exporter